MGVYAEVWSKWDLEPQKSSAAQFITYIASTGASDEKYEIRYEDENIWMSQKMLAQVYGVEIPNIAYHLRKIFKDAELVKDSVIKEILITGPDGKRYSVKHYGLQVIIALGFKIDNERAIAFRKWANQIVSEYTIKGWVMDVPRLKDGSPITDKYFGQMPPRNTWDSRIGRTGRRERSRSPTWSSPRTI